MPRVQIGLDQSLENTGVALWDGNNTIHTTTLVTKNSVRKVKGVIPEAHIQRLRRLREIKDFTKLLVKSSNPERVFLEDVYTPACRLVAVKALVEVRMIITMELFEENIPFQYLEADARKEKSWRRLIGVTNTKQPTRDLLDNYIEGHTTEHECDAIGIMLAGLHLQDIGYNLKVINFKRHDPSEFLQAIQYR